MSASVILCFLFFQAEDGIRDYKVTGVQTCALPIWETSRKAHHVWTQQGNCSNRRSEEHTSELQSPCNLVCRLLLEKKNITHDTFSAVRLPVASWLHVVWAHDP